jgi:hypothetical protein
MTLMKLSLSTITLVFIFYLFVQQEKESLIDAAIQSQTLPSVQVGYCFHFFTAKICSFFVFRNSIQEIKISAEFANSFSEYQTVFLNTNLVCEFGTKVKAHGSA